MDNLESSRSRLLELLLAGNREAATTFLEEWASGSSYKKAMSQLMEPVLEDIGARWSRDQLSLSTGYIAGKVAEDILHKALSEVDSSAENASGKGTIILGNIEDDFHSLGRRMVSIFLQAAGWRVVDLGNDVPAAEFVDAALSEGARLIGVSAMMFTTADNIRKIRMELDSRGLTGKIKFAVGGAVFRIRPELAKEVGADGTTATAIDADKLFSSLWPEGS